MATISRDELFDLLFDLFAASRRVTVAVDLFRLDAWLGEDPVAAMIDEKLDELISATRDRPPATRSRFPARKRITRRDLENIATLETALSDVVKAMFSIEHLATKTISAALNCTSIANRTRISVIVSAPDHEREHIASDLVDIVERVSQGADLIRRRARGSERTIRHILHDVLALQDIRDHAMRVT